MPDYSQYLSKRAGQADGGGSPAAGQNCDGYDEIQTLFILAILLLFTFYWVGGRGGGVKRICGVNPLNRLIRKGAF